MVAYMESQRSLMEALKGQIDASTALPARATAEEASPPQLPSASAADDKLNARGNQVRADRA
eukprot:3700235-Alexandrium_andersonii.AAC.1